MKYYLVALFENDSYEVIEKIQKDICRKNKIFKNMPVPHITLEVIADAEQNTDKLYEIISDTIKGYKKFKVESSGIISFDSPYKSFNLMIENKGYIIRLARIINQTLKEHGFNVNTDAENINLNVSLASTNFSGRELNSKEFNEATEKAKVQNMRMMATVNRIELWKSTNNKKETVVKSFPFKTFI